MDTSGNMKEDEEQSSSYDHLENIDDIRTYHCVCSQFILGISPGLDSLPKRSPEISEDSSIVISREKNQCVFTMDAYRDRYPVIVKNKKQEEVWWVYKCPRCKTPIGYDLEGYSQRFTYILPDALHEA